MMKLRWLPQWPGESLLGQCTDSGCQPVHLQLNQSKLATLITPTRFDPPPTRLALTPQPNSSSLLGQRAYSLTEQLAQKSGHVTNNRALSFESHRVFKSEQELLTQVKEWSYRQRMLTLDELIHILLFGLLVLMLLEVVIWESPRL